MAENRQSNGMRKAKARKIQVVNSAPSKLFKEKYLTAKGKELLANDMISKSEAWAKYGKNRYISNPDSKPVKTIVHQSN